MPPRIRGPPSRSVLVAKELLPVLDRPVIQYVVEEAASAGISDVLLVTSRDKRANLQAI